MKHGRRKQLPLRQDTPLLVHREHGAGKGADMLEVGIDDVCDLFFRFFGIVELPHHLLIRLMQAVN